jgi:hypothetical protein
MLFSVKNPLVKKEMWDGELLWCNSQFLFIAEVRGEVFARSHSVVLKRHSSMWNWQFGLPGRILYEQFPWCQRKVMNMLLTLLFTCLAFFFSVSVSLDFPCTALTFFPGHLYNNCQDLLSLIFPGFAQNLDAHLREITDTRLQIKGCKTSRSTQQRTILYTDSQDLLLLSSTRCIVLLKLWTGGSISPGNYGYPFLSHHSDTLKVSRPFMVTLYILFEPHRHTLFSSKIITTN